MSFDYTVKTNQDGPHERLLETVRRHLQQPFQHPISQQQRSIFAGLDQQVQTHQRPVILDCGCGTAMSTTILAERYPKHWVIGIDKSAHRLARTPTLPDNALVVQADLVDFILLAAEADWQIDKQYHLYPNPWPKAAHLKRRWYGHPILPTLMALCPQIEVRSNWRLYCEEWLLAAETLGGWEGQINHVNTSSEALTYFERKYFANGQHCHQLVLSREGTGS